jgi:hypothetical protein
MGVLLMLMSIGGVVFGVVLIVIALATGRRWLRNFVVAASAVWFGFYALMLLGFSVASKEQTLGLNEPKEFCGFYLDCHVHTEVTGVRTAENIGDITAAGRFYIVTVKVFSDARNPSVSLRLLAPEAVIIDRRSNRYTRNLSAENLLPSGPVDLGLDIHSNESIEKDLVFDVPTDAADPRLDIREGYGIDHVIEAVLVDDEDSLLHRRKYFDLNVTQP